MRIKVIHLFDKYLNTSMNWAYRLLQYTPDTDVCVAAPMLVKNRFLNPDFQYIKEPIQDFLGLKMPENEWNISRFRYYWYVLALRSFYPHYVKSVIVKEKIDILHAHFATIGVEYMHIAKSLNVPLIVSFYGIDYERVPFEKPRYRKWYKMMFEKATFIICEGENGPKILSKMGCPPEKIRIVKLGIDGANIPFFTRKKVVNQLRLIQAATFTEKKGFLDTLLAFAKALKTCPNMYLTLVGEKVDANYYKKMSEIIDKHQLSEKVEILDFVADDFHQFLQKFDVFIHPSRYSALMECEGGAPVVLLDAQATGLPIISTRHCDIPSEVVDGATGLLSDEGVLEAIAHNIKLFYEMENTDYQRFALTARKHVLAEYDSKNNCKTLRKVYEEAILS